MNYEDNVKIKKNSKYDKNGRVKKDNWSLIITVVTFFTALALGFFSDLLSSSLSVFVALLILIVIVMIGIACDIIGLSIATADPKPFHAMASNKVKGAGNAIRLINSAEKATNFFNDVVGDIAGIISGATGAAIGSHFISGLKTQGGLKEIFVFSCVSAVIAAVTVGGKAMGKKIAIKNATEIVFFVAKIISVFEWKKSK